MFDRAVAGIFFKSGSIYESIGSGTFVFFDGQVYLMSAAHVFEELKRREKLPVLHIGETNRFYEFRETQLFVSNTELFGDDRQRDTLDIGVMILPEEFIDELNGKFLMITKDLIENDERVKHLQFYQALGYPNVRNDRLAKKSMHSDRPQDVFFLRYSGGRKLASEIEDELIFDEYHVVMNFNPKKGFDDEGNKLQIGSVTGLSGGLIQGVLYYAPHASGNYPTYAVGIVTQKTKKNDAIIGTKFCAIFEWLELHKKTFRRQRTD